MHDFITHINVVWPIVCCIVWVINLFTTTPTPLYNPLLSRQYGIQILIYLYECISKYNHFSHSLWLPQLRLSLSFFTPPCCTHTHPQTLLLLLLLRSCMCVLWLLLQLLLLLLLLTCGKVGRHAI